MNNITAGSAIDMNVLVDFNQPFNEIRFMAFEQVVNLMFSATNA